MPHIIGVLFTLLIFCIIAAVLCWAARSLLAAFGAPQPVATVIYVIVVLILLCVFLSEVGFLGPAHGWRL